MPQDQRKQKNVGENLRLEISSLRRLEFLVGVPRSKLRTAASVADSCYAPFPLPIRQRPFQKKFKEKKPRTIDNPLEPLRGVQRQIQRKLLGSLDLPSYMCGGVKGRTLVDNVTLHAGANYLVTVDINDFFPSIDNQKVYHVWTDLLGCTPRIGSLLTRLTTRLHYLPQGSSTSTTLANLVLFSVDQPIREACSKAGVRYSTWVDDLAFSGPRSPRLIPIIIGALKAAGFAISREKVKVMGPGARKVLNGILLGPVPTVLPDRVAQLRAGIHKLRTSQIPTLSVRDYLLQLGSSIAQVASIDSVKGRRLQAEFELARKSVFLAS